MIGDLGTNRAWAERAEVSSPAVIAPPLKMKFLLKGQIMFWHVQTCTNSHDVASDSDWICQLPFITFHSKLLIFAKCFTHSFWYGQMISYCITNLMSFFLDFPKHGVCFGVTRHHFRCTNSIIHICCVLISLRVLIHFCVWRKIFPFKCIAFDKNIFT